ncbi:hypothetical protein [Sinomonas sp. ASV322]|uniref:hypothetical protein n=1 Tax=Sinomonas sp. ASV322 TaxID=3041920 RepID=UPI0027DBF65B|nr:hypothetical protein [Sinomonas sp. ASV322]MDQ4501394.1 hypothetical protein [Sinomonas sp. ASV322]
MAGRGQGRGSRGGGGKGGAAGNGARPGPHRPSAAVYRRRRLVAAGLLVVVLVLLGGGAWALVRGMGHANDPARAGGDAGPVSTLDPTPSASAPPAAPATAAAPTPTSPATPTCDPAKIEVAAATDKPVYAPTENPVLTLKVTNKNAIPCPVNVGTSQMEYLVVSGADRIFDSKDCQSDAADLVKTIAAGASETANFPWPRIRSTEGCKAVTVKPLPGTYVLTTSLGSLQSPKAVFTLK